MTREFAHTQARRYDMAALMADTTADHLWVCPDTSSLRMDAEILRYASQRWRAIERGEIDGEVSDTRF